MYSTDSDSDETPVASQENSFRPTVDLKKFEQLIAEEENKPEVPYSSAPRDVPNPNTSHPLHNAKKVHTTNTTATTTSSQPKDKLKDFIVDNSLPTVTDISTIDIDTVAGANDGDTVDSEVSNDMGSKVQASLKFEDGVKHNDDDDALKSVLNPAGPQQQHLEYTKVCTVCFCMLFVVYFVYLIVCIGIC